MSLNKKEPKLDTEKYNKIVIYAGVRDWSDCIYSMDNGEHWIKSEKFSEEESEKFREVIPCIKKIDNQYYWNIEIDMETGIIKDWKRGFCIDTHFKVCDDIVYWICNKDNKVIYNSYKKRELFVPKFLEIMDEGDREFICIFVDGDGQISRWRTIKSMFHRKDWVK